MFFSLSLKGKLSRRGALRLARLFLFFARCAFCASGRVVGGVSRRVSGRCLWEVGGLSFFACCVLSVVRCVLCVACCVLCVVCRVSCVVCCVLCVAYCVLCVACCFLRVA